MKTKIFSILLITTVLFSSCKRNSDNPLWNVDVLAPLVQSSLSIANLVKDTSYVKTNPDNSLTIVSRQELAKITLDSLVALSTPPFSQTVKLNSLVLDTRIDTTTITVGDIADQLIATGDPDNVAFGQGIKFAAQFGIPIDLSNIPVLTNNTFPLDISQFFQSADIATGTLSVKIVNNLPADVSKLKFNFKNKVSGTQIVSNTFTNISANGGVANFTQNLAGKQVEGKMVGTLDSLLLQGPSSTSISLNQSIMVILTISGVTVNSATAVFPAQDVVQNSDDVTLVGMDDVELTLAKIETGFVRVEVYSTAQDKIYFTYGIPSATLNGVPFEVQTEVPAASPGNTAHVVFNYDFKGYQLDLTGENHDTVNSFFNTLSGRIKYTGKKVFLSLSDSITVSISTVNLKPAYVKGYLGKEVVNLGPAYANVDIFKSIESGTLNFENINMKVTVDNGFGLDGSVLINNLTAYNSKTGASQTLTGPNVGTPININKATDNPYLNAVNTIDMSTSTNATSLINILPDKVNYDVQVKTNLAGNTGSYSDFAYNKGALTANLDIEMPLSLLASQLVLSDTVEFSTSSIKKQSVNSGTFKVLINNGFPLEASLKMYFLNSNGVIVDSVKSAPNAIMAAPVNAAKRVFEKRASQVVFTANEAMMDHIYSASKVIFKIQFTTEPNTTFLKIYSDYAIDFKLVGDMNYSVYKK